MPDKKSILVLCGGQSPEHKISILSAKNVASQLRDGGYNVAIVYILQDGRWCFFDSPQTFCTQHLGELTDANDWIELRPGAQQPFQIIDNSRQLSAFDCVFPVLHGANGEDGAIQGLLDILGVPYVGPSVLGAAITMHKDVTKQLLHEAGLPITPWIRVTKNTASGLSYAAVVDTLGSPFFVKANSLGSSIGVIKVSEESQFAAAMAEAFQYDDCVLIEKAIVGREIECSVLGNDKPVASLPGEIINHVEFYSYTAKYCDDNAATVQTPADLSETLVSRIRQMAVDAFVVTQCQGMARVDFFVTHDEMIYINELNSIPGFTDISMYAKNWDVSGLSQVDLLDKLIQLAMARFEKRKLLQRSTGEQYVVSVNQ